MLSSLSVIGDRNLGKPCMVPDLEEFRASGHHGLLDRSEDLEHRGEA